LFNPLPQRHIDSRRLGACFAPGQGRVHPSADVDKVWNNHLMEDKMPTAPQVDHTSPEHDVM
jgi:hypothetical protein